MTQTRFNLRVYGLLVNERQEVLVSDERIAGMTFTKFPGGGLEFGEGTRDCLIREWMEEMEQPIEILNHFYTTDYFQESAFRSTDQLISIYYTVRLVGPQQFAIATRKWHFPEGKEDAHAFRWEPLSTFGPDRVKWPVDKVVAQLLRERFL